MTTVLKELLTGIQAKQINYRELSSIRIKLSNGSGGKIMTWKLLILFVHKWPDLLFGLK